MAIKVNPQQDTGWGLIFRLNALFNEIEDLAPAGKYDEWNLKLDRIWSNLIYRNPLEFEQDDDGRIISVEFADEDIKKKEFFDNQLSLAKKNMSFAKRNVQEKKDYQKSKEYIKAKNILYSTILMKEIWLRKFMYELGLYLKETEYNPAGAMWGK